MIPVLLLVLLGIVSPAFAAEDLASTEEVQAELLKFNDAQRAKLFTLYMASSDIPCDVVRSLYQGQARSGYVWNIECSRYNRTWAVNFQFDASVKILQCSALEVVVKVRCFQKASLPW